MLGVWQDEGMQAKLGIDKQAIVDWIYNLQITSKDGDAPEKVGFLGGTFLGDTFATADENDSPSNAVNNYHYGHIAMTYTAICTLSALGDDFTRLDKDGILHALKMLQLEDGSFRCVAFGSEHDMRFLYCACCISLMLNDWSSVDIPGAVDYIRSCRAYDGAIGLVPGQEGHGGSTFCALASLVLMNRIDDVIDEKWRHELLQWCTSRQIGGMQGRPNKLEDTCYSFWIGGSLRLLGEDELLSHEQLRAFVMKNQSTCGGFSKQIGAYPDILHAFYSMAYLNFSQNHFDETNDCGIYLRTLNSTLGICRHAALRFPGADSLP